MTCLALGMMLSVSAKREAKLKEMEGLKTHWIY